jgi:hypothetical protein
MGLFRRRPKPDADSGKSQGPDVPGARTVHERIEVTVEREWVSMVVRSPAAASTVDGATTVTGASSVIEGKVERALDSPDSELPKGD